ncbi:uncharacterized protein LOC120155334 [Hibiscus syriacus]|uniref:uncharacterized protein LOC120155334 n=1 Tax=Hibiscus syriacus TaxID=106335 RepID=UPI001923F783|nr:uncharacterized protein LOC120155334 [Hibiscus syriacus]
MGGCATKPKEFSKSAEPPVKSKKSQPETGDHDNTDGGENKTEETSVEVSEPKVEAQPLSSDEPEAGGGGEPISSKDDDDAVEPVKKAEVDQESSGEEAKSNENKEE